MGILTYIPRILRNPKFVLNENFILHPVSSYRTAKILTKDHTDLFSSIQKLSNDSKENLSCYIKDIDNNSEFHRQIEEKFENFYQYLSKTNLDGINYFKENPAGRISKGSTHNAGRFLYLLIRSLKPDIMIETGVSSGESSSYILQAMRDNNKGKLYSIDLPGKLTGVVKDQITIGPESGPISGWAIPEYLRDRWEINLGSSEELLLPLLKKLEKIDIFFHDSLHTYDHMFFEYTTSWDFIKKNGVLISDDIATMNGKGHSPLVDFARNKKLELAIYYMIGGLKKH